MFQFFKILAGNKPRSSNEHSRRRSRMEFLESRCMLSAASDDLKNLVLAGVNGTNSGVIYNSDNSHTLGLPSFEGITRGQLPQTENAPRTNQLPPANPAPPSIPAPPPKEVPPVTILPLPEVVPPTKEIPPYIPPAGDAGKPEEPSWNPIPEAPPPIDDGDGDSNPGGPVDIDKDDFSPNVEPASPTDPTPSDVAAQRETRDVLQMLSSLQYSVDQRDSSDRLEQRQDTAFQVLFRDLAEQLNQRQDDNERDGGAVAIAADEVAAELQAARAWEPSYELLRDVSVQLETSSGRYQAFEVSTFGEEMLPTAEAEHALLPVPPTTSFESSWSGEELPVADDAAADTPEQLPATEAPLSAAPPVDESRKITWTSAVAIVTLGIVLQIFRDWKLEGLRTQAAVVWQQWVGSPPWFRRRSSATRQQDHLLPQTAHAQQSLVTEPRKTA